MLPHRRNVIGNNINNEPIMIEDEDIDFEHASSMNIQKIIINHQNEQKPIKYIDFS
jgi:hypothetical protein